MKENVELLQFIYQNAKMGLVGIDNIKDIIKDKEFLNLIKEQENDYFEIANTATNLLTSMRQEREELSNIAKVMTFIDSRISTMNDSSNTNIAKMLITGNNKGIIEIQEKINNYQGKNNKVLKLAKKLLEIEKRNIEKLKKYL